MDEEIKKKLSSTDTWSRGFFMLLFVIVLWSAKALVAGIVIFQFLTRLLAGAVNERLVGFSANLAQFISEIVLFVTYVSDEKPFPFNDWPAVSVTPSSETPKTKKKPAKKKTSETNNDNTTTGITDSPIPNSAKKPDDPVSYQ